MYNGRIIWYRAQPPAEGGTHRYFLYLDETLRHMEATGRMTGKIGRENAEEIKEIQEAQLLFLFSAMGHPNSISTSGEISNG
jgi:hypothetical protein